MMHMLAVKITKYLVSKGVYWVCVYRVLGVCVCTGCVVCVCVCTGCVLGVGVCGLVKSYEFSYVIKEKERNCSMSYFKPIIFDSSL